ncbi:MAG: hypothetical protein HMLKMBBP_01461 [Planctomycetes bacterium]|nr:hypothetical protein [Planctomycetota bacterium]
MESQRRSGDIEPASGERVTRRTAVLRVAKLGLGSLALSLVATGRLAEVARADEPGCGQTWAETGERVPDATCGNPVGTAAVEADLRCRAVGGEGHGVYEDAACNKSATATSGVAADLNCGQTTGDPAALDADDACGKAAIASSGALDPDNDCGAGTPPSQDSSCGKHGVVGQPSGYPDPDQRCAVAAPGGGRFVDAACGTTIGSPPMVWAQGDNDCAVAGTQGGLLGTIGDNDCGANSLVGITHSDSACMLPQSGDSDCGMPWSGPGGVHPDGSDPE